MTRNEVAERIISIAHNAVQAFPFGEYVRHLLAGTRFEEINLFFGGNPKDINTLMKVLEEHGFQVIEFYRSSSDDERLVMRPFTINSPTDPNCRINCCTSSNSSPFCRGEEPDVNCLYLHSSLGYIVTPSWIDQDEVRAHIYNREFVAENTVPKYAIDHLIREGYKWLNPSSKISEVIVSTDKIICPECNGTGELDFGLYKRTCGCKLM